MAIYAVGDIQGCYTEFQQLLEQIRFDPAQDELWLVGDLVNRGPDSLQVLRLVKSLGDSAITVLGNHDLHLLAVAEGAAELHRSDTLDEVLNAPDRDELLTGCASNDCCMRKAIMCWCMPGCCRNGASSRRPAWRAKSRAALRGDDYATFFTAHVRQHPHTWDDDLDRLQTPARHHQRLHPHAHLYPAGRDGIQVQRRSGEHPAGYMPWFDVPKRKSRDATVIFGHWSALGLKLTPNVIALDTGCLWGGPMTAIRLEDRQLFQVSCKNPVAKNW